MSSQKKLAFLGLGLMGLPMASHLVRAGHHVTVWNRSQPSIDELIAETKSFSGSVTVAESPKQAAENVEGIFSILFDGKSTLEAVNQMELKDKTVVVMSTISIDESQEIYKIVQSRGGKFIECPVLGNSKVARAANLQIIAGADDPSLIEQWKDVLNLLGTIRNVGGVGKALLAKFALNQLIAANLCAWSTSYALIQKGGVNEEEFMKIVANGPINLNYYSVWAQKMQAHNYSDKLFSVYGLQKDVGVITQAAEELGLDVEFLKGMQHVIGNTVEQGHGPDDFSSLYEGVLNEKK